MEVRKINWLRSNVTVEVEHTWREGNKVVDLFANSVFLFCRYTKANLHIIIGDTTKRKNNYSHEAKSNSKSKNNEMSK